MLDEQGQTQKFAELMSDDVDIADAYCGHVLALTERELDAAIDNMSWKKREEVRRRSDERDKEASASVVSVAAEIVAKVQE